MKNDFFAKIGNLFNKENMDSEEQIDDMYMDFLNDDGAIDDLMAARYGYSRSRYTNTATKF